MRSKTFGWASLPSMLVRARLQMLGASRRIHVNRPAYGFTGDLTKKLLIGPRPDYRVSNNY